MKNQGWYLFITQPKNVAFFLGSILIAIYISSAPSWLAGLITFFITYLCFNSLYHLGDWLMQTIWPIPPLMVDAEYFSKKTN
jgi:hypothetical protein